MEALSRRSTKFASSSSSPAKPDGDWATSHGSVHDVLENKKANAMLVFILFSTEENLVFLLCCCFAKVLPSHLTESEDVQSVPVHFVCEFLEFPCSS